MRIWFPLLLAPILTLADQSLAYMLSGWACAHQQPAAVHGVHAATLAACVFAAFLAWGLRRRSRADVGDERERVRHFLAGIAIASAVLAAAVIAAMWMATAYLSPCFN